MLRFEIAKLFGVLPLMLLQVPISEMRKMRNYYFAVKDQERKALDPDGLDELGAEVE